MDDQEKKDAQREAAEDKMINDAFQHLLDTYLASRHRKKTDIITKAYNFARQASQGCSPHVGRTVYHAPHHRCTDSM